jgi:peptidoglycan hydrolase CwlO-like protein
VVFALEQLVLRALFVTALVMPGVDGLVETDQLDDLRDQYDQTLQERQNLVDEMKHLKHEYDQLVRRIEQLKTEGTQELDNRVSVEQLLSRSRDVANKLEDHQSKLGRLDDNLAELEGRIVDQIDRMTRRIEQRLSEVSDSEHASLVEQLNRLQEIRQQHRAPLPEAPDTREINDTLEMASEVRAAHPEQMQAAADELQDTEDQVRKRLEAIEKKLQKLQNTRTLARRARTFQSEEQFFDEEARPRVVGRHRDSDNSGSSSDSPSSGAGDRDGLAGSPKRGTDSEESSQGDRSDPGATEPPPEESPGTAPDNGTRFDGSEPEAGDRPQEPARAPENRTSGRDGSAASNDPFADDSSVILENDSDPSTSISSGFKSDDALGKRIEKLEREREKLENQADKLENRAESLQNLADEARDLD